MTSPTADIDSSFPPPAQPDTRLVTVAHPRDDIEAQLIVNLLADAGIEAMATGGSLAGFRAETPADVCVVVRATDAEGAWNAMAAVRPVIDDALVGDDTPPEPEASRGGIFVWFSAAALVVGSISLLAFFGWWLAGLPLFEASPLGFVLAFGMQALLWWVWRRRMSSARDGI
jgi:hypothetical protein